MVKRADSVRDVPEGWFFATESPAIVHLWKAGDKNTTFCLSEKLNGKEKGQCYDVYLFDDPARCVATDNLEELYYLTRS